MEFLSSAREAQILSRLTFWTVQIMHGDDGPSSATMSIRNRLYLTSKAKLFPPVITQLPSLAAFGPSTLNVLRVSPFREIGRKMSLRLGMFLWVRIGDCEIIFGTGGCGKSLDSEVLLSSWQIVVEASEAIEAIDGKVKLSIRTTVRRSFLWY